MSQPNRSLFRISSVLSLSFAIASCSGSNPGGTGGTGGTGGVGGASGEKGICGKSCTEDDDCSFGDKCDTASGACKDCLSDADCKGYGIETCGAIGCLYCATDADCEKSGQFVGTGRCSIDGQCEKCDVDKECDYEGNTELTCDTVNKRCVSCLSDADCKIDAQDTGMCTPRGTCHACGADAECKTAFSETFACFK